jgi:hypothetical protein
MLGVIWKAFLGVSPKFQFVWVQATHAPAARQHPGQRDPGVFIQIV